MTDRNLANIPQRSFLIIPGNSGTVDNEDGIVIVLKANGDPEWIETDDEFWP